jgi:rhodanese-related sulfurtransferase
MFSAGWRGWTAAGEEASTEATPVGSFGTPDIAPELLAAAEAYLSTIPDGYYGIQRVDQLDEMMEATDIFLLDVRVQAEVDETGIIPGALHIDLRDLAKNLDQIPTDQPVVVYCKSGMRASLAGGALHLAGFENVRIFTPGMDGWLEAGMDAVSE